MTRALEKKLGLLANPPLGGAGDVASAADDLSDMSHVK